MSGQLDRRQWPKYGKCGKKHPRECRARTTGCYKCGKKGHLIKDYSLLRNDQKKEELKKTNARVFAITQADANAGTSVVLGEILIAGISTYALIDLGATHSFASMIYVKKLDRSPEVLLDGFSSTLPSGEVLHSNHWLKAVPMHIDGRELFTNSVILEMQDYDVILGMDWLSKYNATIDCKKKRVVF